MLVLDLDGTITDPLLGISRSLNFALRSFGYPEVPEGSVAEIIGPPLDAAFRRFVPDASEERIDHLVVAYRQRYGETGYAEAVVYPGMAEVLAQLAGAGVALGVCTSKRADFAEKVLGYFGLRHLFTFVCGGEVRIAKHVQLRELVDAGCVGLGWVMVGDRGADMEAAKLNRLGAAGVLWGYGTREELRDAGAERLLSDPVELTQLGVRDGY